MNETGGVWDRREENVYFIASNLDMLERADGTHRHKLIAVNEIADRDIETIERWCDTGSSVFIDSGVYNLANGHAVAHGLPMDVALGLAPEAIDGFDALFKRYVSLVRRLEGKVWGYIEIDQGGLENKRRTRARLEDLGLRPIPVYHPFNDGWDYFDELAEGYDRICFGNVVQANHPTRVRLLATAWERRRRYPNLWIHMLGMTPNEWLNAFPVNSCDSSSWVVLLRWTAAARGQSALKTYGVMNRELTYKYGEEPQGPKGHFKATALAGYEAMFLMENWRALIKAYRDELGCDPGLYV